MQPSREMTRRTKDSHDTQLELAASRKLELGNVATQSKWLIDPRKSTWLPYWDFATAIALCFTALVTPYEVAYLKPNIIALFMINRLVDVIFGTDIIFQFFLAHPLANGNGAHWVLDLPAIRRHYLKGWFVLDLLSTLVSVFDVIGFIMADDSFTRLKALRVLRVMRLIKLLRLIRGARIFKRCEGRHPRTCPLAGSPATRIHADASHETRPRRLSASKTTGRPCSHPATTLR
eukprot:3372646-Prymnesium_polylepis.3